MRPRVFPAEDHRGRDRRGHRPRRFNEAAGIPRGRLIPRRRPNLTWSRASMRPRVFPAEDNRDDQVQRRPKEGFNEAAGIPRGKRPRLSTMTCRSRCFNEAAGIPRGRRRARRPVIRRPNRFNEAAGIPRGRPVWRGTFWFIFHFASMRPRVFPAEDAGNRAGDAVLLRASMRPRVFPAEDEAGPRVVVRSVRFNEAAGIPRGRPRAGLNTRRTWRSFNEAAGIPRGRRGGSRQRVKVSLAASMRPRVFPAEDGRHSRMRRKASSRFNEAAGIPRGRPARCASSPRRSPRFNEAAGIPRGRHLIGIRNKRSHLQNSWGRGSAQSSDSRGEHLMHPLILQHQITPKTSRYTRCSMSMLPNVSINGRIRSSGQLGRWWYSISPCRNSECVRRFTVFAFNQRS